LVDVEQIAVGGSEACALFQDGTVGCFSYGYPDSIVSNGAGTRPKPVTMPGHADVVELAAGSQADCARRSDNRVFCWGNIFPGNGSGDYAGAPPTEVLW